MTSTIDSTGAPGFPAARAAKCPFDPPPTMQALRERTPLARVRLWDGTTPWLVTRYAEQRVLLADPRVSADMTRPGYPSPAPISDAPISFILMDDPEHARLRRMVTAPFTIKRVEAMRPAVQKIVDDLIDDMLTGPKPVDLVQALALPMPSLVICQLLGVPYTDHDFFQEHSSTMINRDAEPEQRRDAAGRLFAYLDELIGEKLTEPGDDLLSGLTERIRTGELTRPDAAQIGVLMLIAGHETTANMIALGTLALLEHPDQLELLRDSNDPKLVAGAVEELLRYLHITHNGRRRVALEDIEIAGGDHPCRRGHHPGQRHREPGPGDLLRPRPARHPAGRPPARGVRLRGAPVPRAATGTDGTPGCVQHAVPAHPHVATGGRAGRGPVQTRRLGVRGVRASRDLVTLPPEETP